MTSQRKEQAISAQEEKVNDVYDLLFGVRSQLLVLEQLIGDTNNDTVQINAYGLSTLISNINDQVWEGIERLTT